MKVAIGRTDGNEFSIRGNGHAAGSAAGVDLPEFLAGFRIPGPHGFVRRAAHEVLAVRRGRQAQDGQAVAGAVLGRARTDVPHLDNQVATGGSEPGVRQERHARHGHLVAGEFLLQFAAGRVVQADGAVGPGGSEHLAIGAEGRRPEVVLGLREAAVFVVVHKCVGADQAGFVAHCNLSAVGSHGKAGALLQLRITGIHAEFLARGNVPGDDQAIRFGQGQQHLAIGGRGHGNQVAAAIGRVGEATHHRADLGLGAGRADDHVGRLALPTAEDVDVVGAEGNRADFAFHGSLATVGRALPLAALEHRRVAHVVRRHHPLAAGAEVHGLHDAAEFVRLVQDFLFLGVPQVELLVRPATQQRVRFGRVEGQGKHFGLLIRQHSHLLARSHVPDVDLLATAGGHRLAVGTQGHGRHPLLVHLVGFLHGRIRVFFVLMATIGHQFAAIAHVPHPYRTVACGTHEEVAVAAVDDRVHFVTVTQTAGTQHAGHVLRKIARLLG